MSTPRAEVLLSVTLWLAPKYYLSTVCQRFEEPQTFLILNDKLSLNELVLLPLPSVEAQSSHLSCVCCQAARLCLEATSVYFPNAAPQAGQEQCFRPQVQVFLSESLTQRVWGPTWQPFISLCKTCAPRVLWATQGSLLGTPGAKADGVCPFMGFTVTAFQHSCVWPVFPLDLSANFLVLTVVSLQTLPFVARLNSPMGAGRTVVVKGEVNRNAKGLVSSY